MINEAIQKAAKELPEGTIISIEIEKEGYSVYLKRGFSKLLLDGGDGMISDILEGIEIANSPTRG